MSRMSIMTVHYSHQKICDDVTQLQIELDATLQTFLDQAGSKVQRDRQEELKQNVASTKQRLEHLKGYYVCTP